MERFVDRRLEERSVRIYVPLALLSAVGIIGVLQIDAPYVGIFIAFWLFALSAVAAVVTAGVVLTINAYRAVGHEALDLKSVVVAATIPTSLCALLLVVLMERSPQVTEAVLLGAIITVLVIAPIGLFATIFGDYTRRRLRAIRKNSQ